MSTPCACISLLEHKYSHSGSREAWARQAPLQKVVVWAETSNKTTDIFTAHTSVLLLSLPGVRALPCGWCIGQYEVIENRQPENLRDSRSLQDEAVPLHPSFIWTAAPLHHLLEPWPCLLVWPSYSTSSWDKVIAPSMSIHTAAPYWEACREETATDFGCPVYLERHQTGASSSEQGWKGLCELGIQAESSCYCLVDCAVQEWLCLLTIHWATESEDGSFHLYLPLYHRHFTWRTACPSVQCNVYEVLSYLS